MIITQNITKIYKSTGLLTRKKQEPLLAVNNLSFQVEQGQIFGLLGVNGAGKTTVARILCTLLEPTSGTATVAGFDVVRQANNVRKVVNMIPGGERMLYARLTGRENLSYFADLYNVDLRHKRQRIEALLDLVGLTKSADKRVEQYSKGMKQRLQIARGLINDPSHLFMDEPTLGLDAPVAREIRKMIKERLDKTILFTSHYMEEVEELCDAVAILHKGQIVKQGTPAELKQQYKEGYSLALTLAEQNETVAQILDTFRCAYGARISDRSVEDGYGVRLHTSRAITAELVEAFTTAHQSILELREIKPSLEDVLIAIVGEEI